MRVKVRKGTQTHGARIKNTAFFPKGDADSIRLERGEVVREWRTGRTVERTRDPVDQSPAALLRRLKRTKPGKRTKKKVRKVMVRLKGAKSSSAAVVYTPELAERYKKQLSAQLYREELARLRRMGLPLNEARKEAKANRDDIIERLYTIEVEEEGDA